MLASCKGSSEQAHTYFDSLIEAQVTYLSVARASVTKMAIMNGKEDQSTFTPDSTLWQGELDVFRQLSLFERPAYRDAYRREDGVHDIKSNLVIRWYKATRNIPIPEIKFYYYKQFKNLKKVEAFYQQENALYATTRKLVLDFEEVDGQPVLNAYSIHGIQKMVLSDSVKFLIQSNISY
jgi:hypothetical protein